MEQRMIIVSIIALSILFIVLSYFIGYVKGFKKSKEIDNKIIDELVNKYNLKR